MHDFCFVFLNQISKNRCLWNTNAPFPNISRIGLNFDLDLSPTDLNIDIGVICSSRNIYCRVWSFWGKTFLSYQLHNMWETNMTFEHDLWPTDLNINRDHLLIKVYLPTKFEASWAKRSWVISGTRCGKPTWLLTYWPEYQQGSFTHQGLSTY